MRALRQPLQVVRLPCCRAQRRHVYSLIAFWAAFAQEELSDVNEEGYVEVDSPAGQADIFDLSEEDLLQQKNDFLDSISVRRPPCITPRIFGAGAAVHLRTERRATTLCRDPV